MVVCSCVTLASCDALEATRPVAPPLGSAEKFAVVLAVVLVAAVATALVLWRVRDVQAAPRGSLAFAPDLGAGVFALAGVALLLALVVHVGATVRVNDIGCDPPPEILPETILQLRCSPVDNPAALSLVASFVALPIATALIGAARLARRCFALEWLALVAATLTGASMMLAFGGTARGDARDAAIVVGSLFGIAAIALGVGASHTVESSPSSGSTSSGMTMSQRSRQSAQR